jgi:hypothetical protein
MAWLTSIIAEGTITESKKYITERLAIIATNSASYWARTRIVTVTKYPGLDKATAEAKALADSVLANCTDAHTENTGGGSFAAVTTIDVLTDWTKE